MPVWLLVALALVVAAPASPQAVATDKPKEPEARKVSKVDAITVKQKTMAAGYLKLGDIKGESRDDNHKNEIEVLSWSFGTSRTGVQVPPPAGPGTLTITKAVDKSSPQLLQASTSGRKFDQMTITLPPRPGERARTVTLRDVVIASVQRSDSGDVPTESISFNFTKID
ncbi:MAG TPA: type VI secretion system tube protein Hcp [Gemmatimonadaceae bacterium]